MQQTIELIEGEEIVTYQLYLDENASKELSLKLKNLSELRRARVRYDMRATETVLLNRCGYDEYLEMTAGDDREAIVKKYPLLYHLLFGKYKNIEENILEALFYYLTNNKKLIKYALPLYISDNGKTYDEISIEEKNTIIKELFEKMNYEILSRESIQEMNQQIDYISKINAKSKVALIKELKQKLLTAQKNTEFLEQIQTRIGTKIKMRKKESKC